MSLALAALWVATSSAPVVVAAGQDPELLRRLTGQLADLDPQRLVLTASSGACTWTAAARLAEASRARGVVSVRTATAAELGLEVCTLDLVHHRRALRQVQPRGEDRLGASASLEAAALVVRSAVRALLEGAPVGDPLPAAPSEPPAAAPDPGSEVAIWVEVMGSLHRALPALGPGAALGLRAGLRGERLGASVGLELGWPAGAEDGRTLLEVARHRATLGGELVVLSTDGLSLAVAIEAGGLLLRRTTAARATGVVPSPPRFTVVPLAGARLDGRWAFLAGRGGLSASLALDVPLGEVRFTYEEDGAAAERAALAGLNASAGLGVFWMAR